jgi:hypothetical protein
MNTFKTALLWIFAGALVGVGGAALVAPGFLTWNNTPGQGQALCNCTEVTRSTANDIVHYQLIGAVAGAVVFLLLGLLILRALGRKHPPPPGNAPSMTVQAP